MTRQFFDRKLRQINDEILFLGSMVEQAMLKAVNALKNRDIETARTIYDDDLQINEKRHSIENAILILIASHQPVAHDLRLLASMLEIITELERMGDYAKGIAKVIIALGHDEIIIPIRDITKMSKLANSMLRRSLQAFVAEDSDKARLIPLEDQEVDELYKEIYREVVNIMIANPETIDTTNLILWVVHNIERMADRVTNICERTVFIATGDLIEFDTTYDEME
ncbi:MAG: phosphate signaling complex protein PhoU [Anaerolineaceae bacterium]|nr:phosphate signaling complex protein PhoU [Anaerolineaceae bacterium]